MIIYASLDATEQPFQIAHGQPFVTHWATVADDQESEAYGAAVGQRAPLEVSHPWNALDVFTSADLARYCIQTLGVADPPAGQQLASVSLSVANGLIIAAPSYAPGPRAQLPKSVVINRLVAANLISQAMSALMANAADFARWTAPDAPNVYRDDPDAVAMLEAIGANVSQILAPA